MCRGGLRFSHLTDDSWVWNMSDPITTIMTIALGVAGALCLLLALFGERSIDWMETRRENRRQREEALEWAMKQARHESARQMMLEYRRAMNPYHGHHLPVTFHTYERRNDG